MTRRNCMRKIIYVFLLIWLKTGFQPIAAQRVYAPHSQLASGNWFRVSVPASGVYKMDIAFLSNLGLNVSGVSSSSIRVFGNGGQMLPENNQVARPDDLTENAILVADGGDGQLNGSDYILFYANGPDEWIKDSANQRFLHKMNLYGGKSYYYISIGGNGKRISAVNGNGAAPVTVNSYSYRSFHELDSVNLLAGSKEWYGEEFTNAPGRTLSRTFIQNIPGLLPNSIVQIKTNCVSRSAGSSSRFDISLNNQAANNITIPGITGNPLDFFAREATGLFNVTVAQSPVTVTYNYIPGSFNAQGWLNWFEIFARRNLSFNGNEQLLFRDWSSVGQPSVKYMISNATASTAVWDITDPLNPVSVTGTLAGADYSFSSSATRLREFAAFNTAAFPVPLSEGKVINQDLHSTTPADLLIVTHATLLSQAERLAAIHRSQSMRVKVVTTEQVYHEFGSGSSDPVAIRDFVKMYYDKYGSSAADKPKWLLLFGDASYDYRDRLRNNTNLVPAWENEAALDPLSTYVSDDFYGYLDDADDIATAGSGNLLDIGVGRIPASTVQEARQYTDKVAAYLDPQNMGPWRTRFTFIADDEDGNLHLQDAETISSTAATVAPAFNQQKIYLDAYQQESGAGGSVYPKANEAINNQVFNGTLIWNFNGHGGPDRLAEETILDQSIVNSWNNAGKLPLFITATCDFAPYDNPALHSIGENILLRANTGGIALMTTTRLVFAFSNRIMNTNYLQTALQPDGSGVYKTLGDAVKEAKNFTYQTSADISNNRKFTLLGDPALTLAFPKMKARITRVNGIPVSQTDTLRAAANAVIEGEVTDQSGNILSSFNGNVYPAVYDKAGTVQTLANDPGSQVTSFSVQNNILFRGKASVTNGQFRFSFKVPRDISFQYGPGKVSLYAENGNLDAQGLFTGFIVGGNATGVITDHEGPQIRTWLNDELFVNGGITNQAPVLLVKLSDSSGINTAGTGIGHDIVATLDNDNRRYFILNDFFQADLNSYTQGNIRFQLPGLEPGTHILKIKAWDALNNSNEVVIEFVVANDEELSLSHVLNYPNPFTTSTHFWFEHNQPGVPLEVSIRIMTITGRVVKTLKQTIISEGNRSADFEWDGRDEYGDRCARGVYIYSLRVNSPGKKKKDVTGKLVIL